MKIFVISLKDAAARRASATEQLEQTGLEWEFFDAIGTADDPTSYFDEIDSRLYSLNTLREPLLSEIGCYASHLALWHVCIQLNRPIAILEDDFQLAPNFSDVVERVETLVNDLGFIRLETFKRKRRFLSAVRPAFYRVFEDGELRLYLLSDIPLCALAYAISPAAAASLVKASTSLIAPVDKFLQKTWIHKTPIFAVSPTAVDKSRDASVSTIGVRQRKSQRLGLLLRRALYKGLGELKRFNIDKKHLKALQADCAPKFPLQR